MFDRNASRMKLPVLTIVCSDIHGIKHRKGQEFED